MPIVDVSRRDTWRPKRQDGRLLACETLRDAHEASLDLLAAGEEMVRVRAGDDVLLLGCRNPDGTATISGPNGWRRYDLAARQLDGVASQ